MKISQRVLDILSKHKKKFTKGHNYVKNIGGFKILLCTLSDDALYLHLLWFYSYTFDTIFILSIKKGHNSIKM